MPAFQHEIVVDLFRENIELATALLGACAGIEVDHERVERDSIDLTQIAPAAYYADAVAILRDRKNRPVTGVIVEVQRHADPDKRLSWPVYVATLRAKLACATVLLVVAPDPSVAAWARRPIEIGHPGFCLKPIVIGFEDVPRIEDRVEALRMPALATLSALAHPEIAIAVPALEAIAQLPEDRAQLYYDAVMNALPAEIRRLLEARMIKGYEYQSEFARRYYGEGLKKGLEKGREEGFEKGLENGLRAAIVRLARAKLGELSDMELAGIATISDQRILTELVDSLGDANSAASARATLDRVLTG